MPTVLELPAEMLERIAESADAKDLLALRLVSKDTAAKMFRTYTKAHFTTLRLRLSEHHLRIGLDIVQHAVLGTGISKVLINISEIDVLGRWPDLQTAHQDIRGMRIPLVTQELNHARMQQFQTRHERRDLHMLTVIFCILRRNRDAIALVFEDSGRSIQQGARLADELLPPVLHDSAAFHVVFEALYLSGLRAAQLTLETQHWHIPIHHLDIANNTSLSRWNHGLDQLRTVDISAWHDLAHPRETAQWFMTKLAGLQDLQVLKVMVSEECSDVAFTENEMDASGLLLSTLLQVKVPSGGTFFPALRELSLGGYEHDDSSPATKDTLIIFGELVRFLKKMRPGVSVFLCNVFMDNREEYDHGRPTDKVFDTLEDTIEEALTRLTGLDVKCKNCCE